MSIKDFIFGKEITKQDDFFGEMESQRVRDHHYEISWYVHYKIAPFKEETLITLRGDRNDADSIQKNEIRFFIKNFENDIALQIDNFINSEKKLSSLKNWRREFHLSIISPHPHSNNDFEVEFIAVKDETSYFHFDLCNRKAENITTSFSPELRHFLSGSGISLKDCIGVDFGTSKFRFYKDGSLFSEAKPEIVFDGRLYNNMILEGKIADFTGAESFFRQEIKKIFPPALGIFQQSIKGLVSVPSDSNQVALRTYRDVLEHAGSRDTYLLPDTFIIAAGLDICTINSIYTIVDCGAGKTSITTVKDNEIISNRIIDIAGNNFNECIATYIFRNYSIEITFEEAEKLKIEYADVSDIPIIDKQIRVTGREANTDREKQITIQTKEISDCITDSTDYIIEILIRHLDNLEADIANKIRKDGVYLVGNSFKMKGFIKRVSERVPVAKQSYNNTDYMRLGMEKILTNPNDIANLLFR